MALENAKNEDAGRRRGSSSFGLSANRLFAIILTAMFVIVGALMALSHGCVVDSSDEDDVGIPASIQFATIVSFSASPNPAYVGEEVTFWANATSSSSSSMTFTILFDALLPSEPSPIPNPDGGVAVNVTGNPGNVIQNFTYNAIGNFTYDEDPLSHYVYAKLIVNDGSAFNVTRLLPINVRLNNPPEFTKPPKDVYAGVDEVVNLTVGVFDPDDDPVDVIWEFGDGTTATNATDGSYENRYANQTHAWSPYVAPGTGGYTVEYMLNVTATDAFGNNITESRTVVITVPSNIAPTVAITASESRINPGDSVTFYANATDPEGDPLTWVFNYSDGTIEVVHTDSTEPGTLVRRNMTHVFNEVGNYTVRVNVSDALGDNQVGLHNLSASVPVIVAANQLPGVNTVIDVTPGSLIINATLGYLDICLSVEAIENDGENLTVYWYLDDAVDPIVNVSAGGTLWYMFVQAMRVTEARSYNVTAIITDGYEGHDIILTRVLNVTSDNMPPRLVSFDIFYEYGKHAVPNEVIEFVLVISDREHDMIEVVIDFGDDTPAQYFNLTEYIDGNTTCAFTHVYQYPGAYVLTIRFSDNKIGSFQESHTKTVTGEITVSDEFVRSAVIWDWWDYTSLAIVFAIPILILVRMYIIGRRIARLESEGLTLEEARMKKDEMLLQKLLEGGRAGD